MVFRTGIAVESLAYCHITDAGLTRYASVILDLFFSAMEAGPGLILSESRDHLNYYRFQVLNLAQNESALDSVKSLGYLEEKTNEWIATHENLLEEVASGLKINDPEDAYAKPLEFH